MTFLSFPPLVGCRTVGDPKDYARAAWDAQNKNAVRLDDVLEQLDQINEVLDTLEERTR